MWKIIHYLVLFFFYAIQLDSVDAAAYILPEQPKPAKFGHKEGCYIPDLDKVLPYEKPYSPRDGKSCIQYTCNRDNTTYVYTCGVIGIPENCTRDPGNLRLPYPKCCDGILCPKQHVNEDPNPEEIPEMKDDSTDIDPPDPVCVYPTNVSPKDNHATVASSNKLPYCRGAEPVIRPGPVETVAEGQPAPVHPVKTAAETKDPAPVIGPVADPAVEPIVEGQPAPTLPVEPEPVLYPNDPLPILKRLKRPPTDPVCVYPTDVSTNDMHATSVLKQPPYCPPLKDEPKPLPSVHPKQPPKICDSATVSSDSPTSSYLCPPPAADNPIVESEYPPVYHG